MKIYRIENEITNDGMWYKYDSIPEMAGNVLDVVQIHMVETYNLKNEGEAK